MEKKNEYKTVDLGLKSGLKWADRNVGAASPEDYGDYFKWGSVTPDTDKPCDWKHRLFNGGKPECLGGNALKPEYDAAHAVMGGSWRMPTSAEIKELLDGTGQTVETLDGVKGMRFTAPNGNSIFMPFGGFRDGSDVFDEGDFGSAWSSTLGEGCADGSLSLNFDMHGHAIVYGSYRCLGFTVRGVMMP